MVGDVLNILDAVVMRKYDRVAFLLKFTDPLCNVHAQVTFGNDKNIAMDVKYNYASIILLNMDTREQKAADMFECSIRERAMFEAGIKMGTIYHQFVGVPVDLSSVDILERSIEQGVLVQPYVDHVKVTIDRSYFRPKTDEYSYISLTGNMLDVVLKIRIDNVRVTAEMRYLKDLNYPLMYISDVETL